ncbi:hypothetical protein HKX48_008653 [Thoreauomyces humboldtii]|nr:hypothetical protein HKX48_008653 [Thoreauomyces humboldtii]
MAGGYTVNKTLTFVAVLGGMFAGSEAVNYFLKPDLSIPDLLADPDSDPKVQKAKLLEAAKLREAQEREQKNKQQ